MLKLTHTNRKWWILAAMAAALSVVFLDQTAIAVALPPIQKDLQLSSVMMQWVINAYLLSLGILVVFGGKLGDVFGHKRIFLWGINIFVVSSIVCAAANSGTWLIISRFVQGIGGAFMIPVSAVIILHAFSDREQGKAMGLYIAIASIFLSIGPLLSGLLTHYFSWRWIFWINTPLSLISILLTYIAVPERENIPTSRKPLDWLGFITFSVFVSALTFALMEGVNWGWSSPLILFLFVITVMFLGIFIYVEKRAQDPIVYLPLFFNQNFLAAALCLTLFTAAFSSMVFWAILLQDVLGYSAATTGLFYLPATIPVMFMSSIGGSLRDRLGPRIPALLGTTLVLIGTFWIAISAFWGSYKYMLPGFILFGIGPSLVYASVMATSIGAVPPAQMGMASGITSGIRQVGRLLGVAIIGLVITNIESHHVVSKYIYTFAFSMGMVTAGILVFLSVLTSFLLPNQPLKRNINDEAVGTPTKQKPIIHTAE